MHSALLQGFTWQGESSRSGIIAVIEISALKADPLKVYEYFTVNSLIIVTVLQSTVFYALVEEE